MQISHLRLVYKPHCQFNLGATKSEHNYVAKLIKILADNHYLVAIAIKKWGQILFVATFMHIAIACASASSTPISHSPTPDPIQAFVDANSSKGTAVAAIATAEYFGSQLTSTVEARNQSATQQVLAIQGTQLAIQVQSTERAWQATATADSARATAIASQTASAAAQQAIWTQRAVDITSTADAASVQAYATQQYADSRSEELSIERAELINNIAAFIPSVVGLSILGVGLLIALRWSRYRVIPRDARGDAPLLMNVVDGIAYDADRQPTGAGGFLRDDVKALPKLSAGDYLQTTTRDQLLDLKTRGFQGARQYRLASSSNSPPRALPTPNGEPPQVKLIEPALATPLYRDIIPNLVRDAIDAEIISEEPSNSGDSA